MVKSFVGLDIGAENIKIAILDEDDDNRLNISSCELIPHFKNPQTVLKKWFLEHKNTTFAGAAVTGRLARICNTQNVPVSVALAAGVRHIYPQKEEVTVISIGSRGFGVLEIHKDRENWQENSRCSQGTGNFLRQLTERFSLSVEEASSLVADVKEAAKLSGRCPVILKTDMTHLANKGESKERILAGLFDAVCENVLALVKVRLAPKEVLLAGGVSKAPRIQKTLAAMLAGRGMTLLPVSEEYQLFYEALGAALCAQKHGYEAPPDVSSLFKPAENSGFWSLAPLSQFTAKVKRLDYPMPGLLEQEKLVLGFDIGSTGAKLLAYDIAQEKPLWSSYLPTNGDPFGASIALLKNFLQAGGRSEKVLGFGVTGSGREIVGSLLKIAYGEEYVYIINEIAAHATGASYYDDAVDTIFEIGGQDAKYIRLDHGQIFDAAMNEACSAGTGSFLEEQGVRLAGIASISDMNEAALKAASSVSLGQHCSVFMAENIDAAIADGFDTGAIISGLYDSVIQNYLNRVKGNRSIGKRIFCQGMPFAAAALAAAVARRTECEVVVPPHPGVIGCLGIAILAGRAFAGSQHNPLDLQKILSAKLVLKDNFICNSTKGCGEPGNHCRIDRLKILLENKEQRFIWGGSCSLYDRGTRERKLPDLAPDPFRERSRLLNDDSEFLRRGRPLVAMSSEFILSNLYPFFKTFIYELGFDLLLSPPGDTAALKRGIEEASVPYCAPLQLYSGVMSALLEKQPDYLFLPMLRDIPRAESEPYSTACPLSQASAALLKFTLPPSEKTVLLRPVIDMGTGNLESPMFINSCERLAASLGADKKAALAAYKAALVKQKSFYASCKAIGQKALEYAAKEHIIPVVVIGRSYTIYNNILNSNVPNILRAQGALAIPVDCYPVNDDTPVFADIFWGYSQQALRAAHQIRRHKGVYSVFCSNYSCGPDSFTLQFFTYIMENKPCVIIETDGHSGDAGTKTRLEAFLSCVEAEEEAERIAATARKTNDFTEILANNISLPATITQKKTLLIPRMGHSAEVAAAGLRGEGLTAECLPVPTRETLELGRKYTSGKECLPMILTLGGILERAAKGPSAEFLAFLMPLAHGPCRLGCYNMLDKIVFEKLNLKQKISIVSPPDYNYFEGLSTGAAIKILAGFVTGDLLWDMLYHTRPVEKEAGAAQKIFSAAFAKLITMMESEKAPDIVHALATVQFGNIFGLTDLLAETADKLAEIKDFSKKLPTVAVTGEIYVRCDPFANNHVIEELEKRGIRVKFSAFSEWMEYIDWAKRRRYGEGHLPTPYNPFTARISSAVQKTIFSRLYAVPAKKLHWEERTAVTDSLAAAAPYMPNELYGETCLTIGGPTFDYRKGEVLGVVSVGPLECMPSKIAEAALKEVEKAERLIAISLQLNGDPVDPAILDAFAYRVKERFSCLGENREG